MSVDLIFPSLTTRTLSISLVTLTPASFSLARSGFKCSVRTFSMTTSPPAIVAAIMNVPASMRSGITVWETPSSFLTPSIRMILVPAPLMLAPMELRNVTRSTISGSSAAFSMTVRPSAVAAAIRIFSVAPTLGKSR